MDSDASDLKVKLDNSDYAFDDYAKQEDAAVEFIKCKRLVMEVLVPTWDEFDANT